MNFKEFMAQNVVKIENVKLVVSDRFLTDEQKPVEWEIKSLNRGEEEMIMKSCYKFNERSGRQGVELDESLFTARLIAHSVVYPDLNNTELQNSYYAMSAEQLIKVMLTSTEYAKLLYAIRNIGNRKVNFAEKVEQAKN